MRSRLDLGCQHHTVVLSINFCEFLASLAPGIYSTKCDLAAIWEKGPFGIFRKIEFLAWFNSSVSAEHNGASFMKKYLPQAELWLFLSTEVHSHFSAIIKFIPNGQPFPHSRSQMRRLIVPMGSTQRVLILVLQWMTTLMELSSLIHLPFLCVHVCVCIYVFVYHWVLIDDSIPKVGMLMMTILMQSHVQLWCGLYWKVI